MNRTTTDIIRGKNARRSRRSPTYRRAGSALAVSALSASLLFACSSEGNNEDSEANRGGETHSETTPTADSELIQAVDTATSVPGEDLGENFAERIWYPVRDGEADREQNWADLYLPEGQHEEGSVPLVTLVHGGAWHHGAPGVRHIAQKLADRGVAVFNVEYRDVSEGGGWPQTFTDVADVFDYVPTLNNDHPEISIDDETVVGHSAGAQLAAWAGTRGDLDTNQLGADPKFTPGRVVSLSGPLDLVWAANNGDQNIIDAMNGTPEELPEQYDSVDPIQNINRNIPVVATHGTRDNLVPIDNSEHYVDAVDRDGGHAKLVKLDGEDHVSYLQEKSPHFEAMIDIIHRTSTQSRDELHPRLDGRTEVLSEE